MNLNSFYRTGLDGACDDARDERSGGLVGLGLVYGGRNEALA